MKGISITLLVILAISGTYAGNLGIQYGTYVARSVAGTGSFTVNCIGGSGNYAYSFSNLPSGWGNTGNVLTVPNINVIFGRNFYINIQVRDRSSGDILTGNIIVTINGPRVDVSSAGSGSLIVISGDSAASRSGLNGISGVSVGSGSSGININFGGSGLSGSSSPSGSSPFSGRPGSSSGSPGFSGSPSSPSFPGSSSPRDTLGGNPQLVSLYSSYPGLPSGSGPVSTPVRQSPSGAPSTPNPTPQIIATSQAPFVSSRDTNPITVSDVQRNAAFNRQINANKAVANILTVIQRLTSNVNAAQNDIVTLQNLLRQAELDNNNCQNDIFDFANTRAKIQNAINDKSNNLNRANGDADQLQNALNTLNDELRKLITQRNQVQAKRSPNSAKLNSLENELSTCNAKKERLQDQLDQVRAQIRGYQLDIKTTRDSASAAPERIRQIERQVPIVERKIADLRRQLADAESQLSQLSVDKRKYQGIIDKSELQVGRLQRLINGAQARIPSLQSQIDEAERNCARILSQLNTFRQELARLQSNYRTILNQVDAQEALVAAKKRQIKDLQDGIKGLPDDIKLLNAQISRADSALRSQYFICQSSADQVRKAKQNLDAMRLKLQRESAWLDQANRNLQAARSQKQVADVAVEQIISTYTSALPFSVIPNGQGLTPSGIPAGNNPSGSPLGSPIYGSGSGTGGYYNTPNYNSVMIGDLNTYLSRAYEAGTDPSRSSALTSLYPLSSTTLNSIVARSSAGIVNSNPNYQPPSGNIYDFGCSGSSSSSEIYGSGQIYSVQPGLIQVNGPNGLTNLRVAGCTNLESIRPSQTLGRSDQVYFRGARYSGNTVQLHSMTCV